MELTLLDQHCLYPLVSIDIDVPDGKGGARSVPVVSYDLDEMLGTKLRALLQREHGRDLFDLWQAWQVTSTAAAGSKVDPARVGAAFRFYMEQEGSTFKAQAVQAELDRRMQSRKFMSDMDGFLRHGLSYSPQQACDEFCRVFLPHLDG